VVRARARRGRESRARKGQALRVALEALESRQLLATLPVPALVDSRSVSAAVGGSAGFETAPQVAYNPADPQRMAAVWQATGTDGVTRLGGAVSSNGGASWLPFNPDPAPASSAGFEVADDPSVGFDRGGNFYVAFRAHAADDASGAVFVHKFDAAGGLLSRRTVYSWDGTNRPAAQGVTLAVDGNVASFTDPATGAVQGDPFSGNVYVAWSTLADGAAELAPLAIYVAGSFDGGDSYSRPYRVSDGGGSHRMPRLAIAQGTPGNPGGQLSLVWDNFDTGGDDIIAFDQVRGFVQQRFDGAGGAVGDASNPGGDHVPAVTTYARAVALNDPRFTTIDELFVDVRISHPALDQLQVRLLPPVGSGLAPILLVANNTNAAGGTTGAGITGGTLDATFDAQAAASIVGQADPAGTFRPAGSLLTVFGRTAAQLSGTWTLEVTDFRNGPGAGTVDDWSLNFSAGLIGLARDNSGNVANAPAGVGTFTPIDVAAATSSLLGAAGYGGATATAASPLGLAAAPVIAIDNTLGSAASMRNVGGNNYASFQGRIYVAYAGRDARSLANPEDNSDIFLVTSDDGGRTWTTRHGVGNPVNNDLAVTDGFSEAHYVGGVTVSGRPQFQPSVAVDPATGTLALTWLDARHDAARARVATYAAVSNDGGANLQGQGFVNRPLAPTNLVDRSTPTLGPIPDNQSALGNPQATYGFGARSGLAAFGGRLYAMWASDENGGFSGGNTTTGFDLLDARLSRVAYAAGPRVQQGTSGPVGVVSPNNVPNPDGSPVLHSFDVTFDRPVRVGTFTGADVAITGLGVDDNPINTGINAGNTVVVPLDAATIGGVQLATRFRVSFPPQSTPGAYSYAVGPDVTDLVRVRNGTVTRDGNAMDQDADGVPGEATQDRFATPENVTGLPLLVPGPHVVATGLAGNLDNAGNPYEPGPENLALNGRVTSIDVTFDRTMRVASFTPADVLRIVGPAGDITAAVRPSLTVTPVGATVNGNGVAVARTFRVAFPDQRLNGTYSIEFGPDIRSASTQGAALDNLPVDTNRNAGLDAFRGLFTSGVTVPVFAPSADAPKDIPVAAGAGAPSITESTIVLNESFTIADADLALDISFASDPDLEVFIVRPDGVAARLFRNVGTTGSRADFSGTIFDDAATSGDPNDAGITPIANGGPPFSGRFIPEEPLDLLDGPDPSPGTPRVYTLRVVNHSTTVSGTLNGWSLALRKPVADTGLGEAVADRFQAHFRIFNAQATDTVASSDWVPLGPASVDNQGRSGRVGAIAVDPSDPSGNTVYLGAATGGIWKTTNFLTTDPNGPIWIPLTDFGPNSGLNIGAIVIFPQNDDPAQSIIFAGTGQPDNADIDAASQVGQGSGNGTQGAGILRSTDGGVTWTLLDSTDNTPPFGPARDRALVGPGTFGMAVDPKRGPNGVIVYAARTDGLWRSTDTGAHWELLNPAAGGTRGLLPGAATDIALDLSSGTFDALSNPFGNLQIGYVGIQGQGIFQTTNKGDRWALVNGGVGRPTTRDGDPYNPITGPNLGGPAVAVTNNPTPNPGGGRIALAKPDPVPVGGTEAIRRNVLTQGWLYAAVVQDGTVNLYQTKDAGANWTRIELNDLGGLVPTNDTTQDELALDGETTLSLVVDPNDISVVYLGINANPSVIRVDTEAVLDAHAFYLNPSQSEVNGAADGGLLGRDVAGGVGVKAGPAFDVPRGLDPRTSPYINMTRNPDGALGDPPGLDKGPLDNNATFYIDGTTAFANSGGGAKWVRVEGATFFTSPRTGLPEPTRGTHQVLAVRDPLTGLTRLILGNDQGIYTGIDDGHDGPPTDLGTTPNPFGSRVGNLQITQFFYGAIQPSARDLNDQVYGALLYGSTYQNGGLESAGDILDTGALNWNGPESGFFAGAVGTDQQGTGGQFQYWWPGAGGNTTDFFQYAANGRSGLQFLYPGASGVDAVGRTTGLINPNNPTWANSSDLNFAINPLSSRQMVISAIDGRIYRTQDQGLTWFDIGPVTGGLPQPLGPGAARAIAYAAPDPAINGTNVDDNILVGFADGSLWTTTDGGRNWTDIGGTANGLDGSPIMAIATNPARGSHEAYAVTTSGVYHLPDSLAPGARWRDVAGQGADSLFQVKHEIFGNPDLVENRINPGQIKALQVDWRYVLPDDRTNPEIYVNPPASPGDESATSPILYVGGLGGVFRSIDNGNTWGVFPGAGPGTDLPMADVRDLDLSLGKIDQTTGRPVAAAGDPNMLVAFTFGRGAFGVRLAPVVLTDLLALDPKNPNLKVVGEPTDTVPDGGSDSGNDDGATLPASFKDRLTNVVSPYIAGYSQQSAFGTTVNVTLYDLTDPDNPVYVGGWNPADPEGTDGLGLTDSVGRFVHRNASGQLVTGIKVLAGAPGSGIPRLPDGPVRLGVQATDQSGTVGNMAAFEYTLDTTLPVAPAPIDLDDATDSAAVPRPTGTALASGFGAGVALMTDEVDTTLVLPGAEAAPVAADVGKTLEITGGAGWTVGSYTITAVVGDAWQLDRAPASAHVMDGAWRLLDAALVRPGAAAGRAPAAADVGTTLRVTGGAGWTVGSYTITRVVGDAWQLDRAPASAGATGGAWVLNLPENLDDRTRFNNDPSPGDAPLFHVGGPSNRVEPGATVVLTRALIDPGTGQPGTPLIVNRRVNATPSADGVADILDVNTGYGDVTAGIFEDGVLVAGSAVRVITATATPRGAIADGVYLYRAFQIDAAGNISPLGAGLTVTIDATAPDRPTLDLIDEDDTGRPRTPDAIRRDLDDITFVVRPNFQGFVDPAEGPSLVELFINGQPAGSARADATTGYYKILATINMTEGANNVTIRQTDVAGNVGAPSAPLVVTLDTEQPGAINPDLTNPSDTGPSPVDDITADTTPTFVNRTINGQPELAEPFALVQIYAQRVTAPEEPTAPLELIGEALADAAGLYAVTVGQYVQPTPPVTVPSLADGRYQITALQYDIAGNPGRQLSFGATGTIIIDGTDANDHGFFDGTANRDGWAYIEKALNNIAPNVQNGSKTLLVLGAAATIDAFGAGAAVRSAFDLSNLPAAGWSIVHVDGEVLIDQFLSGLSVTGRRRQGNAVVDVPNVRLDDTGILYITTANNTFEDIDDDELRVLNRHGVEIANYVNGGGGLFSHSETSFDPQVPGYGWLTSIFPNLVVRDEAGFGGAVEITPAGQQAFPGLTPADLSTGPWHNWFDGDLGLLSVLATDLNFEGLRVPLILTSIGVQAQPLTITIDTSTPAETAPIDLQPLSDSPQPNQPGYVAGVTDADNYTNVNNPTFDVANVEPGATLELWRDDVLVATLGNVAPSGPNLIVAIQDPGPVPSGVRLYKARQIDRAGNASEFTPELAVTFDYANPAPPAAPDLRADSDTPVPPHPGHVAGVTDADDVTADDSPTFDIVGVEARATLQLLRNGVVVATLVDVAGGTIAITDPDAPDGSQVYTARQYDLAGNLGTIGGPLVIVIDTAPPVAPGAPDLQTSSDSPPSGQPGHVAGVTDTDNVTADDSPTFDVPNVEARATLQLLRNGVVVATLVDVAGGTIAITDPDAPDGVHVYRAQQYDLAGNLGPRGAGLTVTIDTTAPARPPAPDLDAGSDTGASSTDDVTRITLFAFPIFNIAGVESTAVVELFRDGTLVNRRTGPGQISDPVVVADGPHDYAIRQRDPAGNTSPMSPALRVVIDSTAPAPPVAPDLQSASDTGPSDSDNVTSATNPAFDVAGVEPGATLNLLRDGVVVATLAGTPGGTITIADPGPAPSGTHLYTAFQVDVAGNSSPIGGSVSVVIDGNVPGAPGTPDLQAASDTGSSNSDNITRAGDPVFDVFPAEFGTRVELFRNGTLVGFRTGPGAITDFGAPDGTHTYTARQVSASGNPGAFSPGLTVTIDTAAAVTDPPDLADASDTGASPTDNLTSDTTPTFNLTGIEPGAQAQLRRGGVAFDGPGQTIPDAPAGPATSTIVVPDDGGVLKVAALRVRLDVSHGRDGDLTAVLIAPDGTRVTLFAGVGGSGVNFTGTILDDAAAIPITTGVAPFPGSFRPQQPLAALAGKDLQGTWTLELRDGAAGGGSGNRLNSWGLDLTVMLTRTGPGPVTEPMPLADGAYTYTARQLDPAGNLSDAGAPLVVTIATGAPPAPAGPDLQAASDTGSSNSDNVTRIANPTFDVSGIAAGNTAQLLRKPAGAAAGLFIVVGSRAGDGPISDNGPLTDGAYDYAVRQLDVSGNPSPAGPLLTVTVDNTTPSVPGVPDLDAASDTGPSNSDDVTSATSPTFNVSPADAGVPVVLLRRVAGSGGAFAEVATRVGPGAVTDPGPLANGGYEYAALARDAAGNASAASGVLLITVNSLTPPPLTVAPDLQGGSDSGSSATDNITNAASLAFSATGFTAGNTVRLLRKPAGQPDAQYVVVAQAAAPASGPLTLTDPNPPEGRFEYALRQVAASGGAGGISPSVAVTVDRTAPAAPPLALLAADDTGLTGDGQTSLRRPRLTGTTNEPGATIELLDGTTVRGSATAGAGGLVSVQPGAALPNGAYAFRARARDAAGNAAEVAVEQATAVRLVSIDGDFDADGRADLSLYRSATGQFLIGYSGGGALAQAIGAPGDIPLRGDWDGDGRADAAVFRPGSAVYIIAGSTAGPLVQQFGEPGVDIPVEGDFDADGRADFAVYKPTSSTFYIRYSGGGARVLQFGAAFDVPLSADFDGDRKTDIAVFDPPSGYWFINYSGGGARAVIFGVRGDVPVPADYDGDAKADIAVYHPPAGATIIAPSGGGANRVLFYAPNATPLQGDFDGDGKADPGVYVQPAALWTISQSRQGPRVQPFGWPGVDRAMPVPLSHRRNTAGGTVVTSAAARAPAPATETATRSQPPAADLVTAQAAAAPPDRSPAALGRLFRNRFRSRG
jgi:subtilisin-like proprotein convertase family protein